MWILCTSMRLSLWPFYRRQVVPEFSGGTTERFAERLHARMFDYVSSAGPPIQIFGCREVSRVQRHGSKRETGDYKRESSRPSRSRDRCGAYRHRWTCVIIYRKPRDRCSSVILIKQLITMYVITCIPLYINMCEFLRGWKLPTYIYFILR